MTSPRLPADDLADVVARTPFHTFANARVFLTGGTGFFGRWLLESLLKANAEAGLSTEITVLTRSAATFRERAPHVACDPAVTLLEGDVASFKFPLRMHTHILHAATDSVVRTTEEDLAQSIVLGTRHVLDIARQTGAKRFLYVSSGAVYGRGIRSVRTIAEDFPLPALAHVQPQDYDEAKRVSEGLVLEASSEFAVSIARCFAFVGPLLPLDAHFAIGNFIGDALAGNAIHIKGDGTPQRSFLYMSDLAAWLWTMLAAAPNRTVLNVGSDEAISIADLARLVALTLHPGLPVRVDGVAVAGEPPSTYVPDISRAAAQGLHPSVDLAEAIRKTAEWHGHVTRSARP